MMALTAESSTRLGRHSNSVDLFALFDEAEKCPCASEPSRNNQLVPANQWDEVASPSHYESTPAISMVRYAVALRTNFGAMRVSTFRNSKNKGAFYRS